MSDPNPDHILSDHSYCKGNFLNFCSLNVCGLESKVRLKILEEYVNNFDFVGLVETKTDKVDDNIFLNHEYVALQKKDKKHKYGGIHGIGLLVKKKYYHEIAIINNGLSENVLWIKLNKSILGFETVLGIIYIQHEGSPYHHDYIFDNLAEEIIEIRNNHQCPMILLGDLNSRISNLSDVVDIEDEVAAHCNFDEEIVSDLFDCRQELELLGISETRFSCDTKVNNNGRKLLELCKSLNLKIVNGRIGTDGGIGNLTCHRPNGSSLIDYAISSPSLFKYFHDFEIDIFDSNLSDSHCPVMLSMSVSKAVANRTTVQTHNKALLDESKDILVTKWKHELADEYKNAFTHTEEDINRLINRIDDLNADQVDQETMNEVTK